MILSPYTPGSVPPKLPGRADKLQQFRQAALRGGRTRIVLLVATGSCFSHPRRQLHFHQQAPSQPAATRRHSTALPRHLQEAAQRLVSARHVCHEQES